ncbi:hypothetical protein LOD99_14300 [Oopsacas minuta]|uniref:SZT2 n=1 Tax=Oopsacas minuta TaxID=111878 RepID=A0AAV7KGF8_9METZ|nr:hypothetical protein LOD99_14300 [Oopsacas minuta]
MTTQFQLFHVTEFVYASCDKDYESIEDYCWSEAVTVREVVQFVSHLSQISEEGNVRDFNFSSSYYLVHTNCSLVIALDLSSYMLTLLINESSNIFLSLTKYLTHILTHICQSTIIRSEERIPKITITFIIFSYDWYNIGFFVKVLHQSIQLRQDTINEFITELDSTVMSWYKCMCNYSQNSRTLSKYKSIADILQVCIYSFNFLPNNQHKQILLVSLPLSDFPDMPTKNYIVTQLLDQRISCSILTPQPSRELANLGYFPNYSAIRFIARVSQGVVLHPDYKPSVCSIRTISDDKLNLFQKIFLTTYFQSKCNKSTLVESDSNNEYPLRSNKTISSKPHKIQARTTASHLLTSLFQLGFCLDNNTEELIDLQLSRPWDESTLINIKLSEFNSHPDILPLEISIFHTSHQQRILDILEYNVDSHKREYLPFRTQQVEIFRQFFKELIHRLTILDCIYNSNLTGDVQSIQGDDSTPDHEHPKKTSEYGPIKLKAILQNKVRQWHTWMTTCVFHLSLEEPGDSENIHAALVKWGGAEVEGTDFYIVQFGEGGHFCLVSLDASYPPLLTIYFGFHFSLSRNEVIEKLYLLLQNIKTPKLRCKSTNSPSSLKNTYQFYTQDIPEIFRFNFKRNTFLSYHIIKCYFLTRSVSFPQKALSEEDHKLLLQVAKLFVQNKVNDGWSVFKSNSYTTLFQQIKVKSGSFTHNVLVCYFLYLEQVEQTWQLQVDFFLEPIKGLISSNKPLINGISTDQLFENVAGDDFKMLECTLNFSSIGFDYQINSVPSLECLLDNCSTLIFDAPLFLEQGSIEETHQLNDQIIHKLINKLTDVSCLETQIDISLMIRPVCKTISDTDHYLTNLIHFYKSKTQLLYELLVNKLNFRFLYKMEVDSSEAYFITMPTCTLSISQHLQYTPTYLTLPEVKTFPILIYYVAVDRLFEMPSCYFYEPNSCIYNYPNMPISLKHFLTYLQGEFHKSFVDVVVSYIARKMPINPTVFQTCLDYCNQETFHSSLDLTSTLKALSTVTALRPAVSLSLDRFLKGKLPCFIPCPEKKGLYYFSFDQFAHMCERNTKLNSITIKEDVKMFIQLKMSLQRESGVCEDILLQDLTLNEYLQEKENSIHSAILGIDCYTFDTQPAEFYIIEREHERTASSGTKQSSELHLSLPVSHSRTSSLDRRDLTRQVLTTPDEMKAHILVKLIKSNTHIPNVNIQMLDLTITHDGLLTHLLEETQWQINDLTVGALSNNLTSTALLLEIVDHIKQGRELGKLTCTMYYLHENITYSMLALTSGNKERFMGELDKDIPGFRSDKYGLYYNLKLINECYAKLNYWIVMEVSTECPKITFYIHYNKTDRQDKISSHWLFEQGNKAVEAVCRRVFQILLLHDLYNNKMMYSQLSVDYRPEELEEGTKCFFQSNLACPHQFEYNIPVHWRLGRQIAQSLAKKYLESLKCKNANSIYILEEDAATDRIYYMYINTVDNDSAGDESNQQDSRLGKAEDILLRFDVYGVTKPSKSYQELVFNNIEDKMYNEILTKLCDSFSQQANIQLFAQDITFLQPDSKVDNPEETMRFVLPTFVEQNLSSFLFYLYQYIYSTCTRLKKKCFANEVCFKLPSYYPEANLLELSENFFISAERPIQTRSIILIGVILVDKINCTPVSFRESSELQLHSPPATLDDVLSDVGDSNMFNSSYEINVMMWQHGNADCEKMRDKLFTHCNFAVYDFLVEYYFLRIPYSYRFESFSQALIKNSPEPSPVVNREPRTKPPPISGIKVDSRESTDVSLIDLIINYNSNPIIQDKYSNPLDRDFLKGVKYFTSLSDKFDTSTLKHLTGDLPDSVTIPRFFSLLLKHINQICRSFEFTQDLFQKDSQSNNSYYSIDISSLFDTKDSGFHTDEYILVCRSPFHWLQSHNVTGESKRIISKKVTHISTHSTILKYPLDPYSDIVSRDEPFFDTFKQHYPDDVIPRQSFIIVSVVARNAACCSYNCSKAITTRLSDNFKSILSLIRQEVCVWEFLIKLKEFGNLQDLGVLDENVRESFLSVFSQTIHSLSLEEILEKLNLNRISTKMSDFCHFSTKLNQLFTQYLNSLRRSYVISLLDKSKIPLGFGIKDIEIILNDSYSIHYSTGELNVVQFLRDRNLDSHFPQIPLRTMQTFPPRQKKSNSLIYTLLYSYVTQLTLSGYILILVNAPIENLYEVYLYKNTDCTSIILKLCLEHTQFTLQIFTSQFIFDQFIDTVLYRALPVVSILSFENDFFLGYIHSILYKNIHHTPTKILCPKGIICSVISNLQYGDQPCYNSARKLAVYYRNFYTVVIVDFILEHTLAYGLCHIGNSPHSLTVYLLSSNSENFSYFYDSFPQLKMLGEDYEIYIIFDLAVTNKSQIPQNCEVYVVIIRKKCFTGNLFNSSPIYEHSTSSLTSDKILDELDFQVCCQAFFDNLFELAILQQKKENIFKTFISSLRATTRRVKISFDQVTQLEQSIHSYPITRLLCPFNNIIMTKRGIFTDFLKRKDPSLPGLIVFSNLKNDFSIYLFICSRDEVASSFIICFFSTLNGSNEGIKLIHFFVNPTDSFNEQEIQVTLTNHFKKELEIVIKAFKAFTSLSIK